MDENFLAETLRYLMASNIAQARVLRALIASHPNPVAVRGAWLRYGSPSAADAAMKRITDPSREAMQAEIQQCLKDWSERLEADLPPRGTPWG